LETTSERHSFRRTTTDRIHQKLGSGTLFITYCGSIVFGPDLYQSYKNSKIFPASDTYEKFNLAVGQASQGAVATDSELELVDNLADLLVEQYGDSHYAFLASLGAAKLSADLGNYEAAFSRLKWAEEHTGNEADQQLINHRLALVEAQLGDTESALNRLSNANTHFASIYAETRGDIYASLGQKERSIAAYEESIAASENAGSNARNVELKLNNLLSGLGSIQDVAVEEKPAEDSLIEESVIDILESTTEANSEEVDAEQ